MHGATRFRVSGIGVTLMNRGIHQAIFFSSQLARAHDSGACSHSQTEKPWISVIPRDHQGFTMAYSLCVPMDRHGQDSVAQLWLTTEGDSIRVSGSRRFFAQSIVFPGAADGTGKRVRVLGFNQ